MNYIVTNDDGVVLALYEDKNDAVSFAMKNGGTVQEETEIVSESVITESSGPVLLTE